MMREGTLAVSGGTLETAWWGPRPQDAPTLVLLHEGLGCVELWRDVPERLTAATGWGVFAYSRFGYGRSDPTPLPRPMNYMQQEAQVVLPQVLRQAGIRQAALIGHSDGGSIAAVYAGAAGAELVSLQAQPDGVMAGDGQPPATYAATTGNVMGNPATPGPDAIKGIQPDSDRTDREATDSSPQLLGLVTIAAHFFVEDLNIASIRRIRHDYTACDLRQRLARYHRDVDMAFEGWNNAWLDPRFRNFDITGFLPGIHVPILGLQGADDPCGTDEQLRVLQANVSAPVEITLIPGARHAPHLEAKEATVAAIIRFVAGLPKVIPS